MSGPDVEIEAHPGESPRVAPAGQARLASLVASSRTAAASLPPSAFVALAAIVAFLGIERESIWLDEAISVVYARDQLGVMVGNVFADVGGNMLAYQLLLQRWIRLFGESPGAVRALSAVLGVLAAVAVYALCRRAAGRPWALFGAVVFVAHLLFVSYAHEARAYTLMVLAVAVASIAFLRLLERPTGGRFAAYVVCASAMAWIHVMLGFVIAAHGIHAVAWHRREWRWWLAAFAVVAVAWLPMLVAIASQGPGPLEWIPPLPQDLPRQLERLAGGEWLLVPIWALAAGLGAALAIWRKDRTLAFAVVSLAAPIALVVAASMIQPMYLARYMIGVLPAMSLLVARLGERLGRAWLVPGLLILALLISGTAAWESGLRKPPWEPALRWLFARSLAGDSVAIYPEFEHFPYDYYRPRLAGSGGAPAIEDVGAAGTRLWLVTVDVGPGETVPALEALQQRIGARYVETDVATRFGPIRIRLYERPAGQAAG